jgi:sedoheptulose-bisphosphatase
VVRLLAGSGDGRLTVVVLSLLSAVEHISSAFRKTSQCEAVNSQNSFGDEQLNVDILSNDLIFKHLARTKLVATASSEETPQETRLGGEGFSVAFDPLDGSSIVACNFTVGTIAGVWAGDRLVGQKSRDLKAVVGAPTHTT